MLVAMGGMEMELALPSDGKVQYSATALHLDSSLSFDEWAAVGDVLGRIDKAVQFWIGDWCNFGEAAYGEKYSQAIDATGLDYQSVADYAWVASKVSARNETLTWTHHREVAKLTPDDQVLTLDTAEANGWSTRELKDYVRALTASEPKLPVDIVAADTSGDGWSVLVGDFRDRLSDPKLRGTVDLILTDPPYPKDDLYLYRDLAAVASELLHDRGLLAVYAGNFYIPEVITLMQEGGMTYGWTFCLLMDEGSQSRIMGRHIMQAWKPVFVFTKGTWPSGAWMTDVVKSAGRDKSLYEWQQDAVAIGDFVDRLSPIRGRVVDPFLGVGTTGVAAVQKGREFIGVEVNHERAATAIGRLAGPGDVGD